MALEDGTWTWGGVTFPLTSSTSNSLLLDGDPTAYYLLAYLASVIQTHVGGRWTAQTTAAGRTDITVAVGGSVAFDPSPYLTDAQWKFPLLAVYRSAETYEIDGAAADVITSEWIAEYILPPMRPADVERLAPMLRLVASVVRQRLERGQDDGYSATSVRDLGGFASAHMARAEYGSYEPGREMVFPVVRMTIDVKEKEGVPSGAYDALDTIQDAHIDLPDGLTGFVGVRINTSRAYSSAFSTAFD